MFPRQKIILASIVAFILPMTGTHPVVVSAQSQDSELALEWDVTSDLMATLTADM